MIKGKSAGGEKGREGVREEKTKRRERERS